MFVHLRNTNQTKFASVLEHFIMGVCKKMTNIYYKSFAANSIPVLCKEPGGGGGEGGGVE